MSLAVKNQFVKFGWGIEKADAACKSGKLTEAEYLEITGQAYTGEPYIPSDRVKALEEQLAQSENANIELYEMVLVLQEGGAV